MDGSTPLFLPQMGTVYQAVTPVAETLVRVVVGLALVPHALRFSFGLFPNSGSRILSFDLLTAALERSGYRPGRLWALRHRRDGACRRTHAGARPLHAAGGAGDLHLSR